MLNSVNRKISQAEAFEKEGKLLHALQIYKSVQQNEEFRKHVLFRLVKLYSRLNNPEKGIREIAGYLENQPDDTEALVFYSEFLIENDKNDEALDIISRIDLENYPALYYISAMAFFNLGEYEIAAMNFLKFADKNKGSELILQALLYLSKCMMNLDRTDEALKHAEKAAQLDSVNWEVYYVLGIIYFYKGMYLHSSVNISKAMTLNKTDLNILLWKGRVHYKLGEFEETETILKNYLKKKKPTSEIYEMLGFIYLKKGKLKDSETYFTKSVKLDPENEIAKKGLAQIRLTSVK